MENRTDILPKVKIQVPQPVSFQTEQPQDATEPRIYEVCCMPTALNKGLWVECEELHIFTIIPMPENRNSQITHIEYLVKEKLDEIS